MSTEMSDLLPEWAVRRCDGEYMTPGAQLCTRDGRRLGNAVVYKVEGDVAVVMTDMGTVFRMSSRELAEAFHPPEYIMDPGEAVGLRERD